MTVPSCILLAQIFHFVCSVKVKRSADLYEKGAESCYNLRFSWSSEPFSFAMRNPDIKVQFVAVSNVEPLQRMNNTMRNMLDTTTGEPYLTCSHHRTNITRSKVV